MSKRNQYSDMDYLLRVTTQGNIKIHKNIDSIRQSIKMILSTTPGERVREPTFGSNLKAYLFEPVDDITSTDMEEEISTALERWENRIQIIFVRVNPQPEDAVYELTIKYRNLVTGRSEVFGSKIKAEGF